MKETQTFMHHMLPIEFESLQKEEKKDLVHSIKHRIAGRRDTECNKIWFKAEKLREEEKIREADLIEQEGDKLLEKYEKEIKLLNKAIK